MYADYNYYTNVFAGSKIPAEAFAEYAQKAERLIDYLSQHKITEVTDDILRTVCAAAESAYDVRTTAADIPWGIKSENTDGYSVTYQDTDPLKLHNNEQKAMFIVIEQMLGDTGLLYQGVV